MKKHRSPAYPSISLKDAIERARIFFKKEGKHEAILETAAVHWGYSPTSSSKLSTAAALKSFGLLQEKGGGMVQLTPLGLAIVQDERLISPERDAAIKQAALLPKIISELWGKYGVELPSHDTLTHYLKVDRGFNPKSVNDVIRVYKETVSYAGLGVRSNDDGTVAVESSEEKDMNQVQSGTATENSARPPVLPDVSGEEIANIRVSRDCTIRLIATGPYSKKSIEALLAQLKLGIELGTYDDISMSEN